MLSDEIQGPILAGQRPLYATLHWVQTQETTLKDHESATDYDDAQWRCIDALASKMPSLCSFRTLADFGSVSYTFCP